MAKEPFLDLASLDIENEALSPETVGLYLPQRYEFQLVGRVFHLDLEKGLIAAYTDFNPEDWWAKGHFPGHPLVPGVLLTEAAAQVATLLWKELIPVEHRNKLIGFGGLDKVRFRGQVKPPERVIFLAKLGRLGTRVSQFPTQALIGNRIVFEGTILGVSL